MNVDFSPIATSQILPCTESVGYRDPAAVFHEGSVYCFYSYVEKGADGWTYFCLGVSISEDLVHWRGPYLLTEADRRFNYSSPGCVIRVGDEFVMCIQTYPTLNNAPDQVCGDQTSRLYLIRSKDLLHWSEPELMRVHGDDVAEEDMGRMIDPYIVRDIHDEGRYLVFYKQHPRGGPTPRRIPATRWSTCAIPPRGICSISNTRAMWNAARMSACCPGRRVIVFTTRRRTAWPAC